FLNLMPVAESVRSIIAPDFSPAVSRTLAVSTPFTLTVMLSLATIASSLAQVLSGAGDGATSLSDHHGHWGWLMILRVRLSVCHRPVVESGNANAPGRTPCFGQRNLTVPPDRSAITSKRRWKFA